MATGGKRDYYEVLGVPRDASQADVKRAFRELARKHHPDVNPGDPTAEDKFKAINEAYEVLGDPEKRRRYDQFGHPSPGMGDGGPGFDPFSGLGDLFEAFFGEGTGGARRGPRRGRDLGYELELDLEDVFKGLEVDVEVAREENCPVCDGSGARIGSPPRTCPRCAGRGRVEAVQSTLLGRFVTMQPCDRCGGEGRVVEDPCPDCRGAGRVRRRRRLAVKVPPGVDNGSRLRLPGEGEAGAQGGPPGDFYVLVRVKPHPVFSRRGRDLFCELPVSMVTAALGGEMAVPTLEGEVNLTIPAGSQPGVTLRLRGKGMPTRSGRGDLHVTVRVDIPRRLSIEQRRLLEEFARLAGEEPREPGKGFFRRVADAFGSDG
ncbi:MAG: molecular chaperone DnaJ [bacterium]|nr:molecular chaperone DnaJ [bacterium]